MMTEEEATFRRVYGDHRPALLAYFLRRVGADDAPDLTEDVFTVAWRRRTDLPEGREALLWLYGVARRVLSQHHRTDERRSRLLRRAAGHGAPDVPGPEAQVLRSLDHQRVLDALGRMPRRDQEVLRLAYWEELSQREIAAVTASTEGAVKQRLHRARNKLTREFDRPMRRAVGAATWKAGDA